VPDAALALISRSARGAYRDAVSTLDQLAAATGKKITVQDVLQLLGAIEEEALFRLCDLIVDRDTAGALTFIEELSEQGQDLGRLVNDLLEHLRHLLLVQHMGHVPDSLPVTEEVRERLHEQANQLGEAAVLRLCDLLAVAVEDMRQGADPRLPLELALVKVTRPAADLSRESTAYRLEQLEDRAQAAPATVPETVLEEVPAPAEPPPTREPPSVDLEQLQEAWQRAVIPAVEEKSIPTASVLREAHPAGLAGDTLTLEFPRNASFHRQLAEEPKNATLLADALYQVTGRRLALAFELGANGGDGEPGEEEPASEDDLVSLIKETFDAREVEE
jgi:DNA polymerase-3 subunit gamma/tau